MGCKISGGEGVASAKQHNPNERLGFDLHLRRPAACYNEFVKMRINITTKPGVYEL